MNKQTLYKISLNNVEVFAFHGVYPEEQILGNLFILDLNVFFNPQMLKNDEFVNYEVLRNVMLSEMANTQKLLESVLENMKFKLLDRYSFLEKIEISIKKTNPLFGQETTQAQVTLIWNSCEKTS